MMDTCGVPDAARLAGIIDMAPQPTSCPSLPSEYFDLTTSFY
jgi:hypothetical protein